jgi:hypothetical protein
LFAISEDLAQAPENAALREKLDDMTAAGTIQCHKTVCTVNHDMVIYGQPGQEENMAQLATILLHYDSPDSPYPPQREGEILGYSDRDIQLWLKGWGDNPVMTFALQQTQDMRRDLRTAIMKEAGPQWARNP